MKYILIIAMAVVVIGCASTSIVDWTDPKHLEVTGGRDEFIKVEMPGRGKAEFDRRGNPNIIDSAVGLAVIKATGTEVR